MRDRRLNVLMVSLIASVCTGFVVYNAARREPQLLADVMAIVHQHHIDSIGISDVYRRAAEGLILQLDDPYAELYSPEEMDDFTAAHEGHYGGLGMLVEMRDAVPTVARVYPNTPAEGAGFRIGDRIVQVDGVVINGWPLDRVTGNMKGTPGTQVQVLVRRPGMEQEIDKRVTRAVVRIPNVPYALMLEGGIGYVPLLQFGETAGAEVEAAVARLQREGASGLILDLRGNTGGLLDQAVHVAGIFLPRGTLILEQKERESSYTFRVQADPVAPSLPLTVLVDENSASSSEIVAGALQDHDRAVILGERTFGKGVVQTAFRVSGGSLLKITTGEWLTPAGRWIDRERAERARAVVIAAGQTDDAPEPVFRSASGRPLSGTGGIRPDLDVQPDTLVGGPRTFVRAVTPQAGHFLTAVSDLALVLRDSVQPGFTVRNEWRSRLYDDLQRRGVDIGRDTYDGGSEYVDYSLGFQIARLAFGDGGAKEWALQVDTQLAAALELMRGTRSQAELFAVLGRRNRVPA
jgi:carboxyl-terminal processing protease